MTYPPAPLNGALVSGMLAPHPKSSFTYPEELRDELAGEVGNLMPDPSRTRLLQRTTGQALAWLGRATDIRTRMFLHLMRRRPWDLFVGVYRTTDVIQHAFLGKGVASPEPPYELAQRGGRIIAGHYEQVDAAIGELLDEAPPDTSVIVMSDHGANVKMHSFFTNEWLAHIGLLKWSRWPPFGESGGAVKHVTVGRQLQSLRVAWLGKLLPPHWLEKEITIPRESAILHMGRSIDWPGTHAFCDPAMPEGIRVNLRGRERDGIVEPGEEYERIVSDILQAAEETTADGADEPLVKAVRREELYTGPHAESAPRTCPCGASPAGAVSCARLAGCSAPGTAATAFSSHPDRPSQTATNPSRRPSWTWLPRSCTCSTCLCRRTPTVACSPISSRLNSPTAGRSSTRPTPTLPITARRARTSLPTSECSGDCGIWDICDTTYVIVHRSGVRAPRHRTRGPCACRGGDNVAPSTSILPGSVIALAMESAMGHSPTGVGLYGRQLLQHMAELAPATQFVPAHRWRKWRRRHLLCASPLPNVSPRILWPGVGLTGRRAHLFHGLQARVPRGRWGRSVVTFHDLFKLVTDSDTPAAVSARYRRSYLEALDRAGLVITNSVATADELTTHLGVPRERIRVTHLAADERFRPQSALRVRAVRDHYGLTLPMVIASGSGLARKNFVRLVEAFARVAHEFNDLQLVCYGRPGRVAGALDEAAEASGLGNRVRRLGYVTTDDLPALYTAAEALAFPSIKEGFGIPILEAFGCGTPVLTSNAHSMPEVAGDAAVLVDPLDVDSIAQGLRAILIDEELRTRCRTRGLARASQFSWDRTARLTLEVYAEALEA